jgi:hypothetical protein
MGERRQDKATVIVPSSSAKSRYWEARGIGRANGGRVQLSRAAADRTALASGCPIGRSVGALVAQNLRNCAEERVGNVHRCYT